MKVNAATTEQHAERSGLTESSVWKTAQPLKISGVLTNIWTLGAASRSRRRVLNYDFKVLDASNTNGNFRMYTHTYVTTRGAY